MPLPPPHHPTTPLRPLPPPQSSPICLMLTYGMVDNNSVVYELQANDDNVWFVFTVAMCLSLASMATALMLMERDATHDWR